MHGWMDHMCTHTRTHWVCVQVSEVTELFVCTTQWLRQVRTVREATQKALQAIRTPHSVEKAVEARLEFLP